MKAVRLALGDGKPPAYAILTPCCSVEIVIAAWMVPYAIENTAGRIQVQCGRQATDPLRGRVVRGCGQKVAVMAGDLKWARAEPTADAQKPPRP